MANGQRGFGHRLISQRTKRCFYCSRRGFGRHILRLVRGLHDGAEYTQRYCMWVF